MVSNDNSFKILEEGEISNCSIENSFFNFGSEVHSTKFIGNSLSNDLSHHLNNFSSSYKSSKNILDHSLIDPERSFIEMFLMDVSQNFADNSRVVKTTKTRFTAWTDQLLEEQRTKKYADNLAIKFFEQNREKEESLKKREEAKLLKISNKISRNLCEKRNDIVYKIVKTCGYIKSTELCEEAQQIYNTTGMYTAEGRKRTLGGCFFQLVKSKGNLNESQKRDIFYEPTSMMNRRKKQIKNAKGKMKKQLKEQSNKLEQIKNEFAKMNLDINLRFKS